MLKVDAIKRGIVIDHITAGRGEKIFRALNLHTVEYTTALIQNVCSHKLGKKDLIKIDNVIDLDLDIISLIDPHATITIIENELVADKLILSLPKQVTGILKCHNPRCISKVQPDEPVTYYLSNAQKREYRCEFCDTKVKM
jgi:aspartate carbamoyltransferase regulatory subunit